MVGKNNKSLDDKLEQFLRKRKFEKSSNDLVDNILRHTGKIKKCNRGTDRAYQVLCVNIGYASIAIFIIGVVLGYYISPIFQQNCEGCQASYIQDFLYPYGILL